MIEEVVAAAQKISQNCSIERQTDIYPSLANFLILAERQVDKHREIGRAVCDYVLGLVEREKQLRKHLR